MKTVLITGASRGIGRATALKFAAEGFNVIINSKSNVTMLEELKKEILSLGVDCLSFLGDAGDYSFVQRMIEESLIRFSSIDILVNNAGISFVGLLSDTTPDIWNNIINTNLTSVYNCSSLIIPHMLQKKNGKIINISSMWGNVGASCEVAYSASKGGVNAFTKALAKELAPSGIAVNAIAFGAINTTMNSCFSEEELNAFAEEIPCGRLAEPVEAAEMIFTLAASPNYLTGQIITFDGGLT